VTPISICIDADAYPVKQEIYRVAERHADRIRGEGAATHSSVRALSRIRIIRHAAGRLSAGRRRLIITG
jgi:uncharacterized protein YaiI (UPF0178 family)